MMLVIDHAQRTWHWLAPQSGAFRPAGHCEGSFSRESQIIIRSVNEGRTPHRYLLRLRVLKLRYSRCSGPKAEQFT